MEGLNYIKLSSVQKEEKEEKEREAKDRIGHLDSILLNSDALLISPHIFGALKD